MPWQRCGRGVAFFDSDVKGLRGCFNFSELRAGRYVPAAGVASGGGGGQGRGFGTGS